MQSFSPTPKHQHSTIKINVKRASDCRNITIDIIVPIRRSKRHDIGDVHEGGELSIGTYVVLLVYFYE